MIVVRRFASISLAAALGVSLAVAVASPVSAIPLSRPANMAIAQTVAAKAGDTVSVSGKSANLRSGPSTKSKKIASMATGTKLQVTDVTKTGWLKVKGPAGDGYVSGKLVK